MIKKKWAGWIKRLHAMAAICYTIAGNIVTQDWEDQRDLWGLLSAKSS